jgi:hypothetical protein
MFFGQLFGGPRKPLSFWPNAMPQILPETLSPEAIALETFSFDASSPSASAVVLCAPVVDEMSIANPMFDVRDSRGYCPRTRS